MAVTVRYEPAATHRLLDAARFSELGEALRKARQEVVDDVALLNSGGEIPDLKRPLDAGFIELPEQLLAEFDADEPGSLLGRIKTAAAELRERIDRVVLLGIGGSYMGTRALFDALCHPFHNELDREERSGVPRLYFEGNNLDNTSLAQLLDLLGRRCRDKTDVRQRWGIVVVSKSGGTLETAVAFRLFCNALEDYYGQGSQESRECVVPVTGETGKLRDLAAVKGYETHFPIPDGVGGRFSVFTSVGLFPAAVLGLNVEELLRGAAAMTDCFRDAPVGSNPVLDYVATCHQCERDLGQNIRVLSTWGKSLEAVGLWYDQLLAESLGKAEQGATPLTAVNTRDLHSRGQQHQEGTRDKLITNLIVDSSPTAPVAVPQTDDDQDRLNQLSGKSIPTLLSAAMEGTNKAYADADRPTADIHLPKLDEFCLGQLLQMLMLATVVEGRLIGINPYGQPGVEDYKQNMKTILGMS